MTKDLEPEEYLRYAMSKAATVCKARGWSREWKEAGTYLHLEVSEFIESLRGKGKHPPEREAAHVLFVLFSTMAEHNVDIYEVWRVLNQGLYDGWKAVEDKMAAAEEQA